MFWASVAFVLVAQVLVVPTNPAPVASQTALPGGTGSVSGVVVNQDGAPMARATVTITDEKGRSASRLSDGNGAFVFQSLPAGALELVAKMPDFLAAHFGQTKPGRPGTPLTLADGQAVRNVRLTLVRGGVIAGTVTDPAGQPAWGAAVRLVQRRYRGDGPWFAPVLAAPLFVDDAGQYRIHGLPPGEYAVVASPRTESTSMPADERLVPTYYPGSTQIDQATFVSVGPAEQRLGTDIRLLLAPRLKISGRVMGARGAAAVWIDLSSDVPYVSTRPTDNEGRFEFSDLAPGRYRIGASDVAPKDTAQAGRDRQWAMSEATLGAADVTDLTLVLTRGASVSGRVVLEAAGRTTQGSRTVTWVRLFPVAGSALIHGLEELRGAVDAAGRFTVAAVPPGRYYIDLNVPPAWRAKSAMLDGRDVLDTWLDVSSDVDNLAITITDSLTEVSGQLLNAPRSRAAYTVIAFSAEKPLPNALARRVAAAGWTADGFVVTSLPAGKYLLAVLEDAEPGSWYDPRVLEALRPNAVPVTVTDGQRVVQDLRVR